MKIAIVTFEGFNEIDSFVALNILNRVICKDWKAEIVAPTERVTSMNGVTVYTQKPLGFVQEADAVLFGSGRLTRTIVEDKRLMSVFQLEPSKQLIGAQCSGALILHQLGLVKQMPICTDLTTRGWLIEAGACVLDQPFFAQGNIATAGGCLSAQYLAAWVIFKKLGYEAVVKALNYIAPVSEQQNFITHTLAVLNSGSHQSDNVLPSNIQA